MSYQEIINILLGVCGTMGMFLLTTVFRRISELAVETKTQGDKIAAVEVLVAGRYITRDEFTSTCNTLFTKLDSISDKLNGKADK